MTKLKRIAIIGGTRIPFARSGKTYLGITNQDLMTFTLKSLVEKFKLQNQTIGEVALGAVNKHSYDFALARECVMDSGLAKNTPAVDLQKACGTSLEAALNIGYKIAVGQIECGIAGGVDTNSDIPVELKKKFTDRLLKLNSAKSFKNKILAFKGFSPSELIPKFPAIKEKRTGLSMGESCEIMAKTWKISRQAQDELTFKSHINAARAYEEGFFNDLIVEFKNFKKDENLRADTTIEKLAKLSPVFDRTNGTLTAGNSTPLTDGAAAVFLCSEEYAQKNNLKIQCFLTFGETAAVDYTGSEGLLMAPVHAIPRMLNRAGYKFQDFDFYEIHEAFAAQVLCTLKALEPTLGTIDMNKLNTKGGSLALGHPFAATGARILASSAKILEQKGSGKILISICTAGGMGVTAILER
jgi:acetyl-CoA C-acetyltransferase